MIFTKQLQEPQNCNNVLNASAQRHLLSISDLILVVFSVFYLVFQPFTLLLQFKQIFIILFNVLLQFLFQGQIDTDDFGTLDIPLNLVFLDYFKTLLQVLLDRSAKVILIVILYVL